MRVAIEDWKSCGHLLVLELGILGLGLGFRGTWLFFRVCSCEE
jgi:hypothetical protein